MMNETVFRELTAFYKKHYSEIRAREDHKWRAVEAFRAAAPMSAADFPAALAEGLGKTGNLLDSGYYYPRTALFMMMKKDPEAVRGMFEDLYREQDGVFDRVEIFSAKARALRKKYFSQAELPDDDQDEHAVSVYLFLRYPETHYIYKYTAFRAAAELLNTGYVPRRNDRRNLPAYYSLCGELNRRIRDDAELLSMEEARRSEFPGADPEYHLLTEDLVICAATYFRHPEMFGTAGTPERAGKLRLSGEKREMPLEAVPFFDPVEIARYEDSLRDAGLAFVLQQERMKVRSYRISAKKQPRILNAGSALGEGYDILSYDRRGEELRIAVRVTTGSENESFTVSEAERRVSAMDPAHFRLYRVYAFDPADGTGKYSVFRGDLTPFCVNPERYRIML